VVSEHCSINTLIIKSGEKLHKKRERTNANEVLVRSDADVLLLSHCLRSSPRQPLLITGSASKRRRNGTLWSMQDFHCCPQRREIFSDTARYVSSFIQIYDVNTKAERILADLHCRCFVVTVLWAAYSTKYEWLDGNVSITLQTEFLKWNKISW
jgi:hypothetical protein